MQSRLWKFQKGIIREGEMILLIIIDGLNETTKPKNFVSPQWSEYGPIWKLRRAHHPISPAFHFPLLLPTVHPNSPFFPWRLIHSTALTRAGWEVHQHTPLVYANITPSGNITIAPRAPRESRLLPSFDKLQKNIPKLYLNYTMPFKSFNFGTFYP